MNRRVWIGLGVVVLVIVAASGGFFYGLSVGQARADQARQQAFRQRAGGQGGQFPGPFATPQSGERTGSAARGGGIMGTIEAVEGDTLTVNTQEGIIRVRITDTTLIEKYTSVDVSALGVGERVVVSGSRNEDGSITARSLQSLPASQFQQPGQP